MVSSMLNFRDLLKSLGEESASTERITVSKAKSFVFLIIEGV